MTQYYLTEWLSATKANEIPIHIYTIPLQDEKSRHSIGGSISYNLKKLNNYQTITFFEQYIASFKAISEWGNYNYIKYESRVIDIERISERKILERLIKQEIENKSRKNYVIDKDTIRSRKSEPLRTNELCIYPAIHFNISVNENGEIIIGFEYTHRFEYKENLHQLIIKRSDRIKEGIKVIDSSNSKSYEYTFIEIAPYKAGDVSPYLKESIIDYYKRNNKQWKIKGVSKQSLVVHVKDQHGQIFPYLPHLLKLKCSYDSLPQHLKLLASKAIKLKPQEKIQKLLTETHKILSLIDFLEFPKRNMLVDNLGYQIDTLRTPILEFGKGIKNQKVISGLTRGGIYKGKETKVSFFVDPILQPNRNEIGEFINLLKKTSLQLGVKLDISRKPRMIPVADRTNPNLFNSNDFILRLKDLSQYFDGTVIVFTNEKNGELAYRAIKREFGGKQDIVTQFVIYHPSLLDTNKSMYTILNILLGIYAKSGLQPWILAEPLFSDCFIGLDVSHEDGKHSTGILQIIGKDGRMIKQKPIATYEAGEKIGNQTLEDIIYDSIHTFNKAYNYKPKHITFHRDGFCREDLDFIEEILSNLKISFDYIEVIKNVNRRMAVYDNNQWFTRQGLLYKKDRFGYLCATSPNEYIGMARPIKIVQKTSNLSFDQIASDIYNLSFMHIHSMLKTRLPITTHYADLSSTFHNRGFINPSSKHEYALPFV